MPEDLIELNLKVAAIAGWTDIEVWNPKAIKISYVGTNLAHPELGVHIPNYVESIDAIAKVFILLHIDWCSEHWFSLQIVFGAIEVCSFRPD